MITLRAAQIFITACEAGTLTAAATQLNISQPAATKALAQLEARLGGALFDRQGRRLALTPLGAALQPRARALLQQSKDLEAEADRWRTGTAGALKIGVGPSVEYRLLPEAVARFYRQGRRVRLSVKAGHATELVEALRKGQLDLVAADIGPAVGVDALSTIALPEESVGAAARLDHPAHADARLADYPVASATPPDRLRDQPLPWGGQAPDIICDDYTVLARACLASDHILAAPDPVIDKLVDTHGLARLQTPASPLRVKPALIQRIGAADNPALNDLCTCFLAAAGQTP